MFDDLSFASFKFVGDARLAARYVPTARKLLIGHQQVFFRIGPLGVTRHRWQLPDGARIDVMVNGGVRTVIIDVRSVTRQAQERRQLVLLYEFAAQNPFPAVNTIKWFRLFFTGNPDDPWRADVKNDYRGQVLPSEKPAESDGIVCSPVGAIVHCGASKEDHVTWHGPVTTPQGVERYEVRGGGDMSHVDFHANRYCNYQVDVGIENFWWYGTTGRGALAAENFGATTPVAEGFRYVDGVRCKIEVAPTGKVTVTRLDTNQSGEAEPNLPEWTKANELGLGFVFGVWKLNSTCTKAVSVLHGNPWVFDAYDPSFDIGRLLNDGDPAIGGAFQSAVFELSISVGLAGSGKPTVSVSYHRATSIDYVRTAGLAYGTPEKNSSGGYWYAADYGANDELLTARIAFYMRDVFEVDYDDHVAPPDKPYFNIRIISNPAEFSEEADTDPCSIGDWGTTQKDGVVGLTAWESDDYSWVRTKTTEVDIRLQMTGMPDFVLRSSKVTDTMDDWWGPAGAQSVWLWSDGTLGSYDRSGYVIAVAQDTYTACTAWHVRHSGFLSPTQMGEGAQKHHYTRTIVREPEIERALIGLDLRAQTIYYSERERTWDKDAEGEATLVFPIGGGSNWEGCFIESDYQDKYSFGVISPVISKKVLDRTESFQAPAPVCTQWAESYNADQSDEFSFPLITKLWHQMVLGKPNPKTPSGGGFLGPFTNWADYFPYQMITSYDSINWHPAGFFGLRYDNAQVDLIHYVDPDGNVYQTSHDEVMTSIAKPTENITSEEKTNLRAAALTTRGEWVLTGNVDKLDPTA